MFNFLDFLCIENDYDDENYSEGSPSSSSLEEYSAEWYKDIIVQVLQENGLKPEDIKKEFSREMEGFAWFNCPSCQHKRWPSKHAWCVIKLKKLSVSFPYEQNCNRCESKAYPEFPRKSIKKLIQRVVNSYLIKIGKRKPHARASGTDDADIVEGGPHDEGRCGKCKHLGRSCWK